MGNNLSTGRPVQFPYEWSISRHDAPFIHRLPTELIATIIYLLTDPLLLSQVCVRWRRIIYNSPSLWTHLSIKSPIDLITLPHTLSQSSDLPLNIYLHFVNHHHPNQSSTTYDYTTGACPHDGHCCRIFREAEINTLLNHLLPTFHRIKSLSLYYPPGIPNAIDTFWASDILERFDCPAPMLENLTLESGHFDKVTNAFLQGNTPMLKSIQLLGNDIPNDTDSFIFGDFSLQELEISINNSSRVRELYPSIEHHADTLTKLVLIIPMSWPDSTTMESFESYPIILLRHLRELTYKGFHFMLGPIHTHNLEVVDIDITYKEDGPGGDGSLGFRDYNARLKEFIIFLARTSGKIRHLTIAFGHYREFGLCSSDAITLRHLYLYELETLKISTNIPSPIIYRHFHTPKLQKFDQTIYKPDGVSYQHLLPFLTKCRQTLHSLRIHSRCAAPYSLDLGDLSMPRLDVLRAVNLYTPKAVAFGGYVLRFAKVLHPDNLHAVDSPKYNSKLPTGSRQRIQKGNIVPR